MEKFKSIGADSPSSHTSNRFAKYWKPVFSYLDLILVSTAITVAIFFLFYKIGIVPPPYPWTDESAIAADAVETLLNGPRLIYPAQLAGGSLAVYIEAVFMALFGRGLLALRVLSALLSVGLVAFTYVLTRTMFAKQGKMFSQLMAGLTSLWLASSVWFLSMGRVAIPNFLLVAPMTVGCLYLLWRGLETNRLWYFILSGLMLGLFFYGYVPGLFLPIALVVFFVAEWLMSKLDERSSLIEMHWRQLIGLAVTATIVALPIFIYFIRNPEIFLYRPLFVLKTSQSLGGQQVVQNLVTTLASFGLSPRWFLTGKTNWMDFDPLTAVIFDPLTAVLFLIGMLVAIARLKQPAYLFLLVWWATMTLPAAVSSASVGWKLMHRAVGAESVTFVLAALGLVTLGQWLWSHWPRFISATGPLVAVAVLVFAGINSYRFYFADWPNRPETSGLFNENPVRFADWLTAHATPDTVYVFPTRPGASPTARPELFTVRYLYNGQATLSTVTPDETSLPETLSVFCAGKSTVELMLPNWINVDPKGYLDFLLEQHAAHTNSQSRFGYTVKTYRLNSDSERFSNPGPVVAVNIEFDEAIQLSDYATNGHSDLPAGSTLVVTMHWTKLRDTGLDHSVGLSLVDANGYDIAKVDKPLLSDGLNETTSHWAVGEVAADYYLLPIPAHTPPGEYTLQVVVYTTTGERLAPTNGQIDLTSPLTKIAVMPATLPIDSTSLSAKAPVEIPVTNSLRVIGLDVSHPDVARPGDRLRVSLVWQANSVPQQNYGVIFGLIGNDGLAGISAPQPLVSASYPTTDWRRGETLQANYTLPLPPHLSSGEYTLALRLLDLATGDVISDQMLQPLAVEARLHDFSVPDPSRLLNLDFGTTIRLIGYDRPIISQIPREVTVQVYWQALGEMSESYKVFAHLVDPTGTIVGQSDFIPGDEVAPTTGWVAGEIITDTIRLQFPKTVPKGTYQLVIGLYSNNSGVRLPIARGVGTEDAFTLSEIAIGE